MAGRKLQNYLLLLVKESTVRCLKWTIFKSSFFHNTSRSGSKISLFPFIPTKGVYAIWVLEKSRFLRINLCIFPSSVRPSIRNQLKIFFWESLLNFFTSMSRHKGTMIIYRSSSFAKSGTIRSRSFPWFLGRHFLLKLLKMKL